MLTTAAVKSLFLGKNSTHYYRMTDAHAVSRLASVLKRLRKNRGLFEEYNRIIEEQSSRGIISDVDLDIPVEVGHVHYLPHHPVVREDKRRT